MTAIAVSMLVIVVLATAVLAAVGVAHGLMSSARGRRRIRRWRRTIEMRTDAVQDRMVHGLRVGRRFLAEQADRQLPAVLRPR